MSDRFITQLSVTGGITESSPETAKPGAVAECKNALPIRGTGLVRRPGTQFVKAIDTTARAGAEKLLIPVDLGEGDRYLAVLGHDSVRVFRDTGSEVPVKSVTRDADGNITGGGDPDFSYLDLRTPNVLWTNNGTGTTDRNNPERFEIKVGGWSIATGYGGTVNTTVSSVVSPYLWPDSTTKTGQGFYATLTVDAATTESGIDFPVKGDLYHSQWGFSLHVNLDVAGAGTLILPDSIKLELQDPGASVGPETVEWDLTAGASSVPTVKTNSAGFITFTERLGSGNSYRLGFVFDPEKVTIPGLTGASMQARILLKRAASGSDPMGLQIWGAHLRQSPRLDAPENYKVSPEVLRYASAGALTFVANPGIATRVDSSSLTTSFIQAHPPVHFPAAGGTYSVADAGYVFVKLVKATGTYQIDLHLKDTVSSTTKTVSTGSVAAGASTSSDAIASALAAALVDADVAANAQGAVVCIETRDGGGGTWMIESIHVDSSEGPGALSAYTDTVNDLSDLPDHNGGHGGHVVKLLEPGATKDELGVTQTVMRFQADDGSIGVRTDGRWVEGTDYSLIDTLDPTTLPHVLRRGIDGNAAVTGVSDNIYFEWGPNTWAKRVVGSSETNPYPSFITDPMHEGEDDKYITGIAFYSNRLILASGINISASEAGLFDNFWRSTLRALPDSERIDISVATADVAAIQDLAVVGSRLFARTSRGVQAITSNGYLSPRSIGVESIYTGGAAFLAQSVGALTGVFVPRDRGNNGGVVFIFPQGTGSGIVFQAADLTDQLPTILDSGVDLMRWSSSINTLFAHSRSKPSEVVGAHIDANNGEASWFRLDVAQDTIESYAPVAGSMYFLVQRESGLELERLFLQERPADAGQSWAVRLDRRVTEEQVTMALSGTDTVVTLPYTVASGRTVKAVDRSASDFGTEINVLSSSGNTVTLEGDQTGAQFFIGETFTTTINLLRPVWRVFTQTGPVPYSPSNVMVRECILNLHEAGSADISMTGLSGLSTTEKFVEANPSDVIEDYRFRFAVGTADYDTDITISSSGWKPLTLVGVDWHLDIREAGAQRDLS